MKKSLRKFVSNIYIFAFLNSLLLLAPVYSVFMQEHGLSDFQLSIMFLMWPIAITLFQLPVAWLTNKLGQKNMIIFGQFLKGGAFLLWLFMPTYLGFCIGMFLWGIQGAIYNGAFEALQYDELAARRNRKIYAKILGRRNAISTVGSMLSACGSLLLFWGYDIITWISMATVLLSCVFIARIKILHKKKAPKKKSPGFLKLMKTGAKVVAATPCILFLMLLGTAFGNFSFINDYFSVIGLDIGLRKEFVGIVSLGAMAFQMIGQTIAHRFQRLPDWILYAAMSAVGGIFVLFSTLYTVPAIALLCVAYLVISIINTITFSRFQDFVPAPHRSVALSLHSISNQIMYAGVLLVFGLGGEIGGLRYSTLLTGMICLFIGVWAILFVKEKCSSKIPLGKLGDNPGKTSTMSPSAY